MTRACQIVRESTRRYSPPTRVSRSLYFSINAYFISTSPARPVATPCLFLSLLFFLQSARKREARLARRTRDVLRRSIEVFVRRMFLGVIIERSISDDISREALSRKHGRQQFGPATSLCENIAFSDRDLTPGFQAAPSVYRGLISCI